MLIDLLFQDPFAYLTLAIALLFAFTIHEYSHAQIADFQGDHTARDLGRLTVNPFAHFDLMGAFFLFLFGFGWGKPVPFNPYNLRNKKWGPALVALAGPISNFIMAVLVGLLLRYLHLSGGALLNFFVMFVWLNLMLGVFNLIPVPPLDGSHLLGAIIPMKTVGFFGIIIAVFFMMYIGSPYIVQPLFRLITGLSLVF